MKQIEKIGTHEKVDSGVKKECVLSWVVCRQSRGRNSTM